MIIYEETLRNGVEIIGFIYGFAAQLVEQLMHLTSLCQGLFLICFVACCCRMMTHVCCSKEQLIDIKAERNCLSKSITALKVN